jgi:uncharacterized circularly permuted ATP-grasp superfamily protein/uncharacterized alpha-E superfamily protein
LRDADPKTLEAMSQTNGLQGSLFGDAGALGYGADRVYDEMVNGQGRMRPHWQTFMGTLGPLDPETMADRWEEARRLLHQNGVTYNIYGDAQGMERPWPLDMIPLIISAEEWASLSEGLIQRAALLNAVLADLYGPQRLIHSGRLPPTALYANPGFRRSLHGVRTAGGIYLHHYACDVVRAPDGGWRVLNDRTQAPSGSGYALENRAVLTKVLPDSFRHCRARRLAPFFNTFRETLQSLALRSDQPRVVLLTPGPYNEAYFEHVYLARYLGVTLVEGADLTVRDRQVFVKTLSGLEPVDVILRRQDGDYCDPLELRSDSSLGVAGLVQAVRAGSVVVANAIGSGLMESMSFQPYLPAVCRDLLGEELKLSSVPIWWCGDEDQRRYVLEHLDRLVIKPAFPARSFEPILGMDLTGPERRALVERIHRAPWDYVAQERVSLSTAPTWHDGRLEARPMALRAFLCATHDGNYVAMPGGLARVSVDPGRLVFSMQRGGGSKDAWVLAERQSLQTVGLTRTPIAGEARVGAVRPATGDLPSRVADGLFWMGRYAERAEWAVRILRGSYTRLTDGNTPGATEELTPLLNLMAWLGMIPWDLVNVNETSIGRGLRTALTASIFDPDHPHSLRTNVQRLYRTAYTVRDRLSLDLWRAVSAADRQSQQPRARIDAAALLLRLDDLVISLAAVAGLEQESMTRGHGWRFLDFGRRIERAVHTVASVRGLRIVEIGEKGGEAQRMATLEVLLELGESFMTYRQRYFAAAQQGPVLKLLLSDESNPRALAFQLAAIADHLTMLPQIAGAAAGPVRAALDIVATARAGVADEATFTKPAALRDLLDKLSSQLPEISNLLAHAYFSHAFSRRA